MSQYLLPFDSLPLQAHPPTKSQFKLEPSRGARVAEQCRQAAEQVQKHIQKKHQSADNLLLQMPTRRKLEASDVLRREAQRLEQIQSTLRKLADLHAGGTISPDLANLTSRAAVERALFHTSGQSEIHQIYRQVARDEPVKQRILRMEGEAPLKGIPGFFATPTEVASRLVEFALVKPGHTVLEPSAGVGSLIDAVLQKHSQAQVSYCELNIYLLDVLRLKYADTANIHFITRDFEEVDLKELTTRFDRIIMNPPFERGRDIEHLLHAFNLLAPGGLLAAIVSEGGFCRQDKKAQAFREFLKSHDASTLELPPDSFKASGTRVSCRMVRVKKSR
jgi:16S rRNA G1207 methylase RsmC